MTIRPGWGSMALTVLVAGLLVVWCQASLRPADGWVVAGIAITLGAWVLRAVAAMGTGAWSRRAVIALGSVTAVVGAAVAPASDGLLVVPTALSVLVLVGAGPVPVAVAVPAISLAALGGGALWTGTSVPSLLSMAAGVALGVLGGLSRRERGRADAALEREREREAEQREQSARVALARDLHDVLAHTLGGLAVQLDAADAVLEAGRVEEARERIARGRDLVSVGLADARRAVAALRTPAGTPAAAVPAAQLGARIDDLLSAHRALGGVVAARIDPLVPMSAPAAAALERTVQEALSNARRHAPGLPVTLSLTRADGALLVRAENPRGAPSRAGGGFGLRGMRERVTALPGGEMSVDADAGRFVLEVRVPAGVASGMSP